jgi:hypothetical protein
MSDRHCMHFTARSGTRRACGLFVPKPGLGGITRLAAAVDVAQSSASVHRRKPAGGAMVTQLVTQLQAAGGR